MSGRVRYTAEFKQEAVVLSHRVGVVKAARDLGVSVGALHRWRALSDSPTGPKSQAELEKELRSVKQELKHAKSVISVLRKATAIFAKDKGSKKQNFF